MGQSKENVFDEANICARLEVSHTLSKDRNEHAPYLSL